MLPYQLSNSSFSGILSLPAKYFLVQSLFILLARHDAMPQTLDLSSEFLNLVYFSLVVL